MKKEKKYVGTYKVVKQFKKSGRKNVLRRGLSRADAIIFVSQYPDNNNHIVVFYKQFYADKYFI